MGAENLNEVTGEAVITDKAGRQYHVVFDLGAVLAAEKITGKSAVGIMSDPSALDCVAMIMAGTAGYQRRNPGAPRVNPNLAQKILIDSGGFKQLAPVLCESLSCAEGLGLNDDEPGHGDGDEAIPLALPTS